MRLRRTKLGLLTTAARSKRMSGIRQHGTSAELAVRKALTKLGVRYRLNVPGLAGRPDIANETQRFAVYVHGCFWHRHDGCSRATLPTRNRDFWLAKFRANQARDARTLQALREAGFRVCVVWECETGDADLLVDRLRRWFVRSQVSVGSSRGPRVLRRSRR